jgi:hypothetical protein
VDTNVSEEHAASVFTVIPAQWHNPKDHSENCHSLENITTSLINEKQSINSMAYTPGKHIWLLPRKV